MSSRQRVLGDAEAGVGDLDRDAVRRVAGEVHQHLRAGRRVGQGVVDQLGEQVDHVGGGLAADPRAGVGVDLHALVVLHTGVAAWRTSVRR